MEELLDEVEEPEFSLVRVYLGDRTSNFFETMDLFLATLIATFFVTFKIIFY